MLLLSNRSQMRSKRGHDITDTRSTALRVPHFCPNHALTSSVIYYWIESRQHEISLPKWHFFWNINFNFLCKQVSKLCEQECILNNSYLFLIKGVCYPLLCLFPTTEPLWQGTDWTHRWLDGCSFWLPWQIHSVDPPKLPVFNPKCKRFQDLYT